MIAPIIALFSRESTIDKVCDKMNEDPESFTELYNEYIGFAAENELNNF
jgi:hypothetical protein